MCLPTSWSGGLVLVICSTTSSTGGYACVYQPLGKEVSCVTSSSGVCNVHCPEIFCDSHLPPESTAGLAKLENGNIQSIGSLATSCRLKARQKRQTSRWMGQGAVDLQCLLCCISLCWISLCFLRVVAQEADHLGQGKVLCLVLPFGSTLASSSLLPASCSSLCSSSLCSSSLGGHCWRVQEVSGVSTQMAANETCCLCCCSLLTFFCFQ